MLLSKGFVKLRSLGLSPLVLAFAGAVASVTSGCFFIDDHGSRPDREDRGEDVNDDDTDDPDDVDDTDDPDETIAPDKDPETGNITVAIQPDQLLDAKPGEGVGIFVEVTAGGQWHVWTTCDTFTSKTVCSFDIFASTPNVEQLLSYAADQVEGFDTVKDLGDGTLELVADTDSDTDGLLLDIEPGAPLVLEAYLDGKSAEPFVYWVSDDLIHTGAPANPVQFNPPKPVSP
jgi:hypothetical protein